MSCWGTLSSTRFCARGKRRDPGPGVEIEKTHRECSDVNSDGGRLRLFCTVVKNKRYERRGELDQTLAKNGCERYHGARLKRFDFHTREGRHRLKSGR